MGNIFLRSKNYPGERLVTTIARSGLVIFFWGGGVGPGEGRVWGAKETLQCIML